jgi:DNA primase
MRNPDFYKKVKEQFTPDDFVTDFNKRIITHLISLIEGGYSTDLSMFSSDFDINEMNTVTKIAMGSQNLSNTLKECEECIQVLKSEKNKLSKNAAEMSDEEFLSAFNKK